MSSALRLAHIIVTGNEKGGAGKTTTSIHMAIGLARMGFAVAVLDLDHRQASLSRFFDIRQTTSFADTLSTPDILTISAPTNIPTEKHAWIHSPEAAEALDHTISMHRCDYDFIVIDCPGQYNPSVEHAHALADTIVTPMNDSLVDLDLILDTQALHAKLLKPGIYTQMVMGQRKKRFDSQRRSLDWIVLRNRLGFISDTNKKTVGRFLKKMSKAAGYRLIDGFSERVIYRQLYNQGLTVLDMRDSGIGIKMTMSHLSARQEVRHLLESLWLPRVSKSLDHL